MAEEKLAKQVCKPCTEGTPPLKPEEINELKDDLHEDWEVVENHHLKRKFKFKNFKQALEFTNKIGALAETQQHHPDIQLGWGRVVITLHTHKIDGLSKSDFVMAAKIDELDVPGK